MVNLILTSSVLHLLPQLKRFAGFSVMVSVPNKDGKNIFPDGELYVCFPGRFRAEERVVVLHSGAPHPNRGLMELEMMLAALRRAGVSGVEIFFTYMPYGMQDKIARNGETNAAEDLLHKLVSCYRVARIYVIDPHFFGASWLAPLPFVAVSAHELLLAAARRKYPDAVFVAPDKGHEMRTKRVKGLQKVRTDSYTVTLKHDIAFLRELSGKTVGVVDDIIETGGTLTKFHEAALSSKPRALFAVATHGVVPQGIARVAEMYEDLFLSNTVGHPAANVDVTPLIIDALYA